VKSVKLGPPSKYTPKSAFKDGPDPRRNVKGRPPKAQSITEMMREKADPAMVADIIIKGVKGGDARFVSMLLDRTEGKVPDTIVQINTMFKEGDLLADKTILWLTKFHPKLVMEWRKAVGLL
jgi:hypothetical protein